jgi:transposase-like protein
MTEEQGTVVKRRRTAAEIEQIVREYKSSGLNRSQFCRQQGLTLGVLNRYLRRLLVSGGGGANGDGLVAVEVADQKLRAEGAGSCGLAVVLGKGRRIAVSAGFDATTLRRVVQALETT